MNLSTSNVVIPWEVPVPETRLKVKSAVWVNLYSTKTAMCRVRKNLVPAAPGGIGTLAQAQTIQRVERVDVGLEVVGLELQA